MVLKSSSCELSQMIPPICEKSCTTIFSEKAPQYPPEDLLGSGKKKLGGFGIKLSNSMVLMSFPTV